MNNGKKTVVVAGLVLCLCVGAQAVQTQLLLPDLNMDMTLLTDGGTYTSLLPSTQTWNGVTFNLVEDAETGYNAWITSGSAAESLDITVNVFGVTTAYTIINSKWGRLGTTDGMVEFFGSDGAYHAVALVQGTNLRDHYDGAFVNVIDGVTAVSAFYVGSGRARLDMQIYTLPAAFADETLTTIRFTSGADGASGVPFLVAATVDAAGAGTTVPVPGAVVLAALGASVVAGMRRRRML
ncbi:MAG TPA: hypothetical protein PKH24_06900 [Sedimentisphaerales bacterium]|jgi:hypothetical protein|nr:hypothetical protein [Sedimentisphaerales bacterium]HNU31424.1 hypothetical protein [Sedimentisphaerales bacterium]